MALENLINELPLSEDAKKGLIELTKLKGDNYVTEILDKTQAQINKIYQPELNTTITTTQIDEKFAQLSLSADVFKPKQHSEIKITDKGTVKACDVDLTEKMWQLLNDLDNPNIIKYTSEIIKYEDDRDSALDLGIPIREITINHQRAFFNNAHSFSYDPELMKAVFSVVDKVKEIHSISLNNQPKFLLIERDIKNPINTNQDVLDHFRRCYEDKIKEIEQARVLVTKGGGILYLTQEHPPTLARLLSQELNLKIECDTYEKLNLITSTKVQDNSLINER